MSLFLHVPQIHVGNVGSMYSLLPRLRCPFSYREALTMFTSAYWHGVHSGYYLSMLTVPFILAVEDYFDKLVRRKLGETVRNVVLMAVICRCYA